MAIESLPSWMTQLRSGDKLLGTHDAYTKVPMLYRAINLRADAISTVPYSVERKGEPSDWVFTTSLPELLQATEVSMLLTGAAFWLRIKRGRVLLGFRVMNPYTMSVTVDQSKLDAANPLDALTFTQTIGNKTYGPWTSEQIVYFREQSFTDDIGHGFAASEVALQSSQLHYYLERFSSAFFEHGAQPVTIISLPPETTQSEMDRVQSNWLAKFTGAALNSFRTAFVKGGDVKATILTPPLKDLMLPELQERVITNVCMALGVPRTMLEASAANYATADSDRQSFWRETVIPRLPKYAQVINAQILLPLGYKLTFNPEALDVMQTDEAARASSLNLLVQAGVPLQEALDMLGFDYQLKAQVVDVSSETEQPTEIEVPIAQEAPAVNPQANAINEDSGNETVASKDLVLWRRKAEKKFLASKSLDFPFASTSIPVEDKIWIDYHLPQCKSIHDIKDLFEEVKAINIRDNEKPLYNALRAYLARKGKDALALVLQGLELPEGFLDDLGNAIEPELTKKMQEDLMKLQDKYTVDIDDAEESVLIRKQFDAYTPKLIKGLTSTTSDVVKNVITKAREQGGMTNQEIADLLTPAFGARRAELIAVTEYTRSASNATTVYKDYLGEFGVKTTRIWNTSSDEISRDCPLCGPLNNKPEEVWAERYPDGAPAHPRCRCDVTLKVIR